MSEQTEPAHQKDEPKKGMSNLTVRLLTAAVGIPIILWMLYLAPPVVWPVFVIAASSIGAMELAGMTLRGDRVLQSLLVISTMSMVAVVVFASRTDVILTATFGVVLIGALAVLVRPDPLPAAAGRMGWLIAGPVYLGAAIGAIAKLHQFDNGGTWVLLSMALAWGSDTGGYFAGRAFGRHKLYEKISPKKTVEGSIGGLATVVGFALVIKALWLPELAWVHAVVLAVVAGAVGQAGDLCISVIKRSMGVKDSGNILPGHGGLLDRIDALMFTAVVTMLYAHWALDVHSEIPRLDLAS